MEIIYISELVQQIQNLCPTTADYKNKTKAYKAYLDGRSDMYDDILAIINQYKKK